MEESQSWPGSQDDRSQQTAERLRALREQASQKLDEHRQRFSDIESKLFDQVDLLAQDLAQDKSNSEDQLQQAQQQHDDLRQGQEALAESQKEVNSLREQLVERDQLVIEQAGEIDKLRQVQLEEQSQSQQHAEKFAKQLAHCDTQLAEKAVDLEEALQQVDQFQEEGKALREETSAASAALEKFRAEADQNTKQQSEALSLAQEERDTLQQQLSDLQSEHESLRQDLKSAQARNNQAANLLCDAEKKILQLSDTSEFDDQMEAVRRKSELALADVHELKRENAELREELVSRPEADQQESSELVSLRAERDALAARIGDLENAPSPEFGTDTDEQLAELQSRFELAVEDVRHLKQENDVLANKLATGKKSVAVELPPGELDWQAQKEQLLRQLAEEDGEPLEESRLEERATIEGTITITDRIVAEKDEAIAQLKAQGVQEKPSASEIDLEEMKQSLREEILGEDKAVREECDRLQQLQSELQEKMRNAELEFSVERAKLARERVSLDEKLSQAQGEESADASNEGGKPGRRWLSALGLRDENSE